MRVQVSNFFCFFKLFFTVYFCLTETNKTKIGTTHFKTMCTKCRRKEFRITKTMSLDTKITHTKIPVIIRMGNFVWTMHVGEKIKESVIGYIDGRTNIVWKYMPKYDK